MKINENTKVTLTVGQLKKLVKESVDKRTMTYSEVKELISNFTYEKPEIVHSICFYGKPKEAGKVEDGTFREVDVEKLTQALKNPKLRLFVFSVDDSGSYRLVGADTLTEYQWLTDAQDNPKDRKEAALDWEMPTGKQRRSGEGVRVERLR